jgi:hypothetical protein
MGNGQAMFLRDWFPFCIVSLKRQTSIFLTKTLLYEKQEAQTRRIKNHCEQSQRGQNQIYRWRQPSLPHPERSIARLHAFGHDELQRALIVKAEIGRRKAEGLRSQAFIPFRL